MNIQELKKKIKEIAAEKQIHEQEIINGIIANLETVYAPKKHTEQDKQIIKGITEKIITTFLSANKQKIGVNKMTKYDELFGLDRVEIELVNDAWTKLESQRDVYSLMYEIGLTDEGIRKYR